MTQCAIVAAESVVAWQCVAVPLGVACGDLLELFRGVSDGRGDQGRDHPVAAVLALAAAATVAGMKGYRAIAGWISDVPAEMLAALYLRAGAAPAPAPGKTTIWRVLTHADGDTLDDAVGTWLSTLPAGEATPASRRRPIYASTARPHAAPSTPTATNDISSPS